MAYILNSSFLRGLGIGLIISGLIVAFSKGSMSDDPKQQTANLGQTVQTEAGRNNTSESNPDQRTTAPHQGTGSIATSSPNSQPKANSNTTGASAGTKPPTSNNNTAVTGTPGAAVPVKSTPTAPSSFVIPKGSDSGKIAELLLKAGLIKDKQKFLLVADNMKAARRFKADTFSIPPGSSEVEIVLILTK